MRDIDVILELMSSLMNQRRWTEALEKGQILLGRLPRESHANRAVTLYNMGVCYNELGRFAEAETQYAEACREDPSDSDLWYNRANNQHQWGDTARRSGEEAGRRSHLQLAMQYALEARRINPTDSDIDHLIELIRRSM